MQNITAILSILHDNPDVGCVRRRFRGEPILAWTLRRLRMASSLSNIAVLCWEDQAPLVQPIANSAGAFVLAKGPRCILPMMQAITAARKWSDGWRGGILSACHWDLGFHAAWTLEIARKLDAHAAILIDPSAALVDPNLIEALISHAHDHPGVEYVFSQAAPGLSGLLLRTGLLEQLAAKDSWPGRIFSYWPDIPGRDPVTDPTRLPLATPLERTTDRFNMDSDRQIARLQRCTMSLNGTLPQSSAEEIVARMADLTEPDQLPRDITLEINTRRLTRPVYSPLAHLPIDRPDMPLDLARQIFAQLAELDDIRLTLGGVGDPLLADHIFDLIDAAHRSGISTIHLETDLIGLKDGWMPRLLDSPLDILSVYLPAATGEIYQKMMGVDRLAEAIDNLKSLAISRNKSARGLPVLIPTFVKCKDNLHEMETCYDYWLRALGASVIVGPSDYCALIPDAAVADMRPPRRIPCRRLKSRMTILSDGQIVACEQDILPRHPLGHAAHDRLSAIWQTRFPALRSAHAESRWDELPTCPSCREWHRP